MAELRFKVKADITKVSELRKEIERLEGALRRMSKSADGAAFEKVVEKLSSTRKELQGMVKEAAKTGAEFNKSLEAPLSNTASNMDKLNEAIRVQNIEEKRLGQTIRDLKLDRRDVNKESADYEHLNTKIRELEAARNKEKDLLFALREEKKKITAQNRLQTVSEEQIDKIMKSQVLSIRDAETQNKLLRRAVKDVVGADNEAYLTRQKLNAKIDDNTNFIRRNTDAMVQQKMGIGSYKQAINEAWVSIKNGTDTTKNFGIVAGNTAKIMGTSLKGSMQQIQMSVGSMIKGFVGAQAIISGFNKLIGAIRSGVNSIIDFEQANSNLAAILQTNIKGIQTLTYDAKRLGAITRYTASEVTGLQIELAKLGFTRSEILDSTGAVLKFAQATGANLSQAAKLTGSSLRSFNASTTETERYVSAMAVATTKSALSFDYLDNAMSTVAPVAKSFNLSIEDTLALLGSLSDAGFDASSSATATRNILLNLADANGKLAKALGGNARTLPEIVKGLQELRNRGIDLNETLELTDKRSVAAFNTFLEGSDKILKLRDSITGVGDELDAMATTMEDNVAGAIAGLQSAWEAFMLSFSSSTGTAKKVIDFFSRGLRNISNQLASPEQRLAMRVAGAESFASDQLKEFKVIERNTELLKGLYQSKLDAGLNANDAEIAARREFATKYESELKKEEALYAKILEERDKTQEKYDNANFFKQALFLDKTNSWYKKKIKGQEAGLVELSASMYKHKAILDAINETTLKEDVNDIIVPKKELTKEDLRAYEETARLKLDIQRQVQKEEIEMMSDGVEKNLALIEYQYQQELRAINEKASKAGLGESDSSIQQLYENALSRKLNAQEAYFKEVEDKYKTHEQKISEINAKYDNERQILELANNKEAIAELEKARAKALKDASKPLDIDVSKMFGDVEKYSVRYLKELRKKLKTIIESSSADLSATDLKTLTDALKKMDDTLLSKDVFGKLKPSIKKYNKAQLKLNKAKERYLSLVEGTAEHAQAEREVAEAINAQAEAQYKLNKAINAMGAKGNEIVGAGIAFMSMLSDLGIKAPEDVNRMLGGMGKVFGSLESIDITKPFSIVSNTFGIIGGLGKTISGLGKTIGGIFGSSRKARRENKKVLAILEAQNRELEMQYKLKKSIAEIQKQTTVFGTDEWNKSRQIAKQYKEQYKGLQDSIKELNKGEVVTGSYVSKSFWRSKRKDRWEGLLDAYPDLIEASGRFNIELAESILNTQKLDDEGKKVLTDAIGKAGELESVYSELSNQLEAVFGQLGASIMDNFVNAFTAGTDAMEGIYQDAGQMIEGLAKQMVYSMAFGNVMQQANEQMKEIQMDLGLSDEDRYKQMTKILGSTLGSIEGSSKLALDLLEWTKEEAAKQGLEIFKEVEDELKKPTVGRGFETMTQDQASELTGRFTANNMLLEAIRNGQDNFTESILSIDVNVGRLLEENVMTRNIADEILEYNVKSFMELQDIRNNTGTVVEPIKEMSRDIADLKNEFRKQFF